MLKVGTYIKYDNTLAKITSINNNTIKTDTILSSIAITDASATFSNGGIAEGDNAHSEGYNTAALGDNSHAGGNYTIAGYENQTVIGKYNDNKSTTLFEVGKGTAQARSNAFEVHSDGRATVGAGPTNNMDVATKQYADSVGIASLNIQNGSATGSLRTVNSKIEDSSYTIGQNAFCAGSGTRTSGNYSSAFGYQAKAINTGAFAAGYSVEASGQYSHAEGISTKAGGHEAHAEGYYTEASGNYSHAEGVSSKAEGSGAHAEGDATIAKGGHAEGINTFTLFGGCHAEGTVDSTSISGTITAIDQENLKVTVSGFSSSNNLIYQLYNHNNTTFYGDQYITNAQ